MLTQLVFDQLGVNPDTKSVSVFVGTDAVLEIPTMSFVHHVARWVVDTVMAQSTPERFIALVRIYDNVTPGIASLVELADRFEADPGLWRPTGPGAPGDWSIDADPLTIMDGRPFFDRLAFRRLLPRANHQATPPCILVQGDEGTGKSYLHDFCQSFAAKRRGIAFGYTKLGSKGLKDFDPRMLAIELASGLGTDMTKLPVIHADPHRDARNLAAWITSYTPMRDLTALAIIDEVGASSRRTAPLNEAVHTFILELVRLVQADPEATARMRVVLLGYDPGRLSKKRLDYETYVLEHIDIRMVDQWLRLRFPGHPDYRYKDATELLEETVPAAGSTRMRMLCSFVHALGAQFQGVPP